MTQNEKRIEFDKKVDALVKQGKKTTEIANTLGSKIWTVQNALYRLGYGNTKESDDRPTISDYLEAKLSMGDDHKNAKAVNVKIQGKQYQDVSSFFGL